MAALEAHHDVGLFGQPIDDLALAFIPPLGADHDNICHAGLAQATCERSTLRGDRRQPLIRIMDDHCRGKAQARSMSTKNSRNRLKLRRIYRTNRNFGLQTGRAFVDCPTTRRSRFACHLWPDQKWSGFTCWTFGISCTLARTSGGTTASTSTSAMALPPSDSRPRWKVAMLIPAPASSVANRPTKPGLS